MISSTRVVPKGGHHRLWVHHFGKLAAILAEAQVEERHEHRSFSAVESRSV